MAEIDPQQLTAIAAALCQADGCTWTLGPDSKHWKTLQNHEEDLRIGFLVGSHERRLAVWGDYERALGERYVNGYLPTPQGRTSITVLAAPHRRA